MPAKINHIAIVSDNYALAGKFYESVFGMKTSSRSRPRRAVTVGDGYVGLNINPRKVGRPARLDHFGIEIDDLDAALAKMRERYPRIEWVKRPENRPFAAITTHDPDGNVFDLSQQNSTNRTDMYTEQIDLRDRHIGHFAMRAIDPDRLAEFYCDLFNLTAGDRQPEDPNRYVSDGHITMVIMPWHITDYAGTGIVSPCLDHIGFNVENLDAFKIDVDRIAGDNPLLAPRTVGMGPEGKAYLELFRRSCPLCQHHLADVDGIPLSAREQG